MVIGGGLYEGREVRHARRPSVDVSRSEKTRRRILLGAMLRRRRRHFKVCVAAGKLCVCLCGVRVSE